MNNTRMLPKRCHERILKLKSPYAARLFAVFVVLAFLLHQFQGKHFYSHGYHDFSYHNPKNYLTCFYKWVFILTYFHKSFSNSNYIYKWLLPAHYSKVNPKYKWILPRLFKEKSIEKRPRFIIAMKQGLLFLL